MNGPICVDPACPRYGEVLDLIAQVRNRRTGEIALITAHGEDDDYHGRLLRSSSGSS